ncbi:UDP-GlcNAc--UDP-phosphate GlcNAc-1-phosphate transferase [uncultured Maribacter sp.]|uniref:UDP-GlcNAc--UDP-phosphate GlcNAc-1-phosphate transferase n=1 Tax=uncultured Maribacter sp. TaxID=431308 RepID=UPI0026086687|nr:UDP-GlcNAc--UDP-phosphate GlcNAc-1-phosphate transferase [uncultured Maribacter sp.]
MQYILIFTTLFVLAQIYLILAKKFNIIDRPNERSSHTKPTIRGGGIIFFFAVILFFFTSQYQYPYFTFGVLLVALISFIDDIITLGFKIRLAIHFIAITLLIQELGLFSHPIIIVALVLIISAGILNIYNFMDGINGITGLCSLSSLLGFYILNIKLQLVNADLIIYLILSILIFGFYNFRKKALFFAGDVGSITIAVAIIFLTIIFSFKQNSPVILLLIGVYLTDGLITITKRFLNKENIFKPHKTHLYQRLVQKTKLSHIQVSMSYAIIQLLLIIPVYLLESLSIKFQIVSVTIIFFMLTFIHINISKKIS